VKSHTVKFIEKDELEELLLTDEGMLKVAKVFCRGRMAKQKLFALGIDIEILEDILDENETINNSFNEVIDRITEQRYYRSAQIGISNLSKMLVENIENPEVVKICREALAALDTIKKGCAKDKGNVRKKAEFDKFQEALRALGG